MGIIPKSQAPDRGYTFHSDRRREMSGYDKADKGNARFLHSSEGYSGNNLFGVSSIYRAGYNNPNIKISRSSKPSNEVQEHYRKLGEYYKRKYGV